MLRILATVALAAATAVWAGPAAGSQLIAVNATNVVLEVDGAGALVTFRSRGALRRVYASGAINALDPSPARPQVAFALRPGGSIRNGCRPYDGPGLALLVAACKAPDGSFWALQRWQRLLPNYGLPPTPAQAVWELRLSHWSGETARLQIWLDWSYRRYDHLYGTLTYRGRPVYGFRVTRSGSPLDDYARNIYVDTLDSAYGPGWRRENSFLSHKPTGVFCYGFYPHGGRPAGRGLRYRATVIGPGVTPDVTWEGRAPGPYDAGRDRAASLSQRRLFRGDRLCRPR